MKRFGKILLMALPAILVAGLIWAGVDDAPFTITKGRVTEIGGYADDTSPDSVGEGDTGAIRMSLNRNLHVELQDGGGGERALDINAGGAASIVDLPLVWDSDNAGNCAAITNASTQLTLDTGSDYFKCCAWGNTAYVLSGANPTATTTVTTGFSFMIADGQCHYLSTADVKIAVIAAATAGNICCISLEAP